MNLLVSSRLDEKRLSFNKSDSISHYCSVISFLIENPGMVANFFLLAKIHYIPGCGTNRF